MLLTAEHISVTSSLAYSGLVVAVPTLLSIGNYIDKQTDKGEKYVIF
jgi:hypothetical protein